MASFCRHLALLAILGIATSQDSPIDPKPTVLIYIPIHAGEDISHIQSLCDCAFDKRPTLGSTRYDVLLSISGESLPSHSSQLIQVLRSCLQRLNPHPRVLTYFKKLDEDTYRPLITPETKDDSWVSGPNSAFYDAFLEGDVYDNFVRHYDFVQQMETDVCTLVPGWLDALVQPMTANDDVLISGSSVASDCLYYAAFDYCAPTLSLMESLREHINGNALYRIHSNLSDLLSATRAIFENREPFDISIYEVAKLFKRKVRDQNVNFVGCFCVPKQ